VTTHGSSSNGTEVYTCYGNWSSVICVHNRMSIYIFDTFIKRPIPGHLGQLSESMHVFFSLFLDEYRVNRKTFARGGHYLVADWITSFLIRFQTSSLQRIIWKDSTRLGSSKHILTKSTYMCRGIPSLSLAGNIILTICNVFF
jgi:hypothetical protein